MNEERNENYTEITRTYGLACALIWGAILVASVQLVAVTIELGKLINGNMEPQLISLADTSSIKVLYLLLFILLIRCLLSLSQYCFKKVMEIHQYRTQSFNPDAFAREIGQSLQHDTKSRKKISK